MHGPAKVLLDPAGTLTLGGDCLTDVAVLRGQPGSYRPVACAPSVSRTIGTLATDAPRALAVIDGARATTRAAVRELAGSHVPDPEVSAGQP